MKTYMQVMSIGLIVVGVVLTILGLVASLLFNILLGILMTAAGVFNLYRYGKQ